MLVTASAVLAISVLTSLRNVPESKPASRAPLEAEAKASGWKAMSLDPVANPNQDAVPQPARCRPYRIVATTYGTKAYVTLSGKEIIPGNEVVVIDVAARREQTRITVGSQPFGLSLHPSGRWVVVTNRYSNFISVISVESDTVVGEIPALYYCEDIVFSPDGRTGYVSNFFENQVLIFDFEERQGTLEGRLHTLGFERDPPQEASPDRGGQFACGVCGWRDTKDGKCPGCGHAMLEPLRLASAGSTPGSIQAILRSNCGASECHLYPSGGFYAGPDRDTLFRSAEAHAVPGRPGDSPLLLAVTSRAAGGYADAMGGNHHPGGVVFEDTQNDQDYARLRDWIAEGQEGPGITVGEKPRDMVVSPDGRTLYVANTGSLDISVVDLPSRRETRRIYTRSPVNDLVWEQGWLIAATLGVGSGHPKARHSGHESLDRSNPDAEFTLFRDMETGKPLTLDEQTPMGPYDEVDGTAQEKFRDITNDIIVFAPEVGHVAAYKANEQFTRYTSDTFEALAGDKKGDVSPDLMKVVGAFPEQIAQRRDRLYVAMSGTFEVQEWTFQTDGPPDERLVPGRVFQTGFKPTGIAVAGDTLLVSNYLDESITWIDLAGGSTESLSLSRLPEPFPATDFERGEFFVQTSVFSVDRDQSCVHCHYRDASDGQRWSVSQVMGQSSDGQERTGGSREVPDLRALVQKVPFFVEGTLSIDEPLTMMMEHNPLVDFQGQTPAGDFSGIAAAPDEIQRYARSADSLVQATGKPWNRPDVTLADLVKRREIHFERLAEKYFGEPYSFRDLQRLIGEYQRGEPRLLPNPVDPNDPEVRHGRALFENPKVGCSQCHPAPAFTDKTNVYNENKSFPPLVSTTARDNVHTLVSADRIDHLNGYDRSWDPDDTGRVEEFEGYFVVPSLRGLWARPAKFLHHGHAVTLREIVCTPDHLALRPYRYARNDIPEAPSSRERGRNERDGLPDTHGVTSHLSVWDIECLLKYINSIE